MNTANLIPPPDPLGIPSPVLIFQVLAILTLVLHFLFMNYVFGGMIIVTVNEWFFGKNKDVAAGNSILVRMMPVCLSLAITMGVAPLLFVQVLYGQFFYIANIMNGFWWLSILVLLTLVFYFFYIMIAKRPEHSESNAVTKVLSFLSMIFLLFVMFIFTNNGLLVEHPEYWKAIYAGERSFIAPDASLIPRYFHNLFGSLVVGGLWLAAIGRYQYYFHPERAEMAKRLTHNGLLWSTIVLVIQMMVGFWYLYSLGIDTIRAFMGNGFLFVGWSIGVLLAFALLICLILALVKEENPKFVWSAVALSVVILFGMVMGRELLRYISLEQYYTVQELTARPEHSSLVLFLVTFIIGLGILGWMIRLIWPGKDRASTAE